MSPNNPIALPKISTIKIFTNNAGFAASAKAAPDPTMPTQTPHTKFTIPTVRPAPNSMYPPDQLEPFKAMFCSARDIENGC